MAKPTSDPTWATDAAYDTDGDPWGGDANKVDPGSGRRAEGAEPDTFPAEWFNYHLNALGEHVEYIHEILEADPAESIPSVSRTVIIPATDMRPAILTGGADGPILSVVDAGYRLSIADSNGAVILGLNRFVPLGATVTAIRLMIDPGTHSTPGRFARIKHTVVFGTPSAGTRTEEEFAVTTGTTLEVLELTDSFTFANNELHFVVYTPGTLSSGADLLEAIQIVYTDPGPRNF